MSALASYYLLWLMAALTLIAAFSAVLVRHLGEREAQRACAWALMVALARYDDWLAAQRGRLWPDSRREAARAALQEACELQAGCFPRLGAALARVQAADRRFDDFVREQQWLREHDAERWLESEPDTAALALWRAQSDAFEAVKQALPTVLRGASV